MGSAGASLAVPGLRVGHYELREEIGKGGMGVVYRARDLRLRRDVALKRPHPERASDPVFRKRFLHEARATAQLSHKNIVSIIEAFEHDGTPWLVMQFIDGESLRTMLARRGALPIGEALQYAEEIAEALEAAHEHRILHLDINPNNVLISAGHAMVTDFGLAHCFMPRPDAANLSRIKTLTFPNLVGGTLPYVSPEQILGHPLRPPADLFSLGAVFYEVCAGMPAFAAPSGPETLDAILHRDPSPLSRLNRALPEDLDRIVSKTLCKEPEERYQSACDLLVDLRVLRRRIEFESYPKSHPTPVVRPRRVFGTAAAWIAGVLLSAALAAGWVWRVRSGTPASIPPPETGLRIAVLAPVVPPGHPEASQWPMLFQTLLAGELTGVSGLAVADPNSLNGMIPGLNDAAGGADDVKVLDALRAQHLKFVVRGRFMVTDEGYRIAAAVVDLGHGEVSYSAQASVAREADLPRAAQDIAMKVMGFLHADAQGIVVDKDLETWVSLRKQNVEAVRAFMMANQCVYRNEPCAGIYLQQSVDLDPTFVGPRVWLISSLVNHGRMDEARTQYQALLALEASANPFEQTMMAWAGARIRGDLRAQAQALDMALRYSPGNNILLFYLAFTKAQLDDFEGAIATFRSSIESRWRFAPLYSSYGWCLVHLGRFDEARRVLEESIPLVPPDSNTYGLLEALCIAARQPEEAQRYRTLHARERMREGLAGVNPDLAPIYDILGASCLKAGSIPEASTLFAMAVAAEPGDAAHHDNLGSARLQAGDLPGAESELLKALERDRGRAHAHLLLGKVCDARGDSRGAENHYRTYLRLAPHGAESEAVRRRLESEQN